MGHLFDDSRSAIYINPNDSDYRFCVGKLGKFGAVVSVCCEGVREHKVSS